MKKFDARSPFQPSLAFHMDTFKKVALRDISKIEKSEIFVLFENEASYEDFLPASVLSDNSFNF